MRHKITAAIIILLLFCGYALAEGDFPFTGVITEDGANIRCDSTVGSRIICKAKKGQQVIVIRESYQWYKIRLPQDAPSYVNNAMLACAAQPCRQASVIKDNVRVRLGPDKGSPILGILRKGGEVNVLGEEKGWYRIEPVKDSFGWVHKKLIERKPQVIEGPKAPPVPVVMPPEQPAPEEPAAVTDSNLISVTGIVKPYGMVFGRKATHKLFAEDKQIYLLRGDKNRLNAFNHRKVKVTGRRIEDAQAKVKYPVIEVEQIEESG